MIRALTSLAVLIGICALEAETIHVTVGDTGCAGRQLTVQRSWEKIPGVASVSVQQRQSKDPPAQRTFIVACAGASPDQETLRTALGRRAKNYPILDYQKPPAQIAPPRN